MTLPSSPGKGVRLISRATKETLLYSRSRSRVLPALARYGYLHCLVNLPLLTWGQVVSWDRSIEEDTSWEHGRMIRVSR